jgi:hypothetical protein
METVFILLSNVEGVIYIIPRIFPCTHGPPMLTVVVLGALLGKHRERPEVLYNARNGRHGAGKGRNGVAAQFDRKT